MNPADVQVWIETQREGGQLYVVPYAQSLRDRQAAFRMSAECRSGSGRSSVTQQGQITLTAGRVSPLARMSLGGNGQMECKLAIALRSEGEDAGAYSFDLTGC